MFPISELPESANRLMIHNEGVWNSTDSFFITFSDPQILRQLLLFSLDFDSTENSNSCYTLKHGNYYVVETNSYRYRGTSLSVTPNGIGIQACLHNNQGTDNNLIPIATRSEEFYNRDYSLPMTIPLSGPRCTVSDRFLFGDVTSSAAQGATQYIAGSTSSTSVNRLRLFVASQRRHQMRA